MIPIPAKAKAKEKARARGIEGLGESAVSSKFKTELSSHEAKAFHISAISSISPEFQKHCIISMTPILSLFPPGEREEARGNG
jgi:hypothetical protein